MRIVRLFGRETKATRKLDREAHIDEKKMEPGYKREGQMQKDRIDDGREPIAKAAGRRFLAVAGLFANRLK
jgi:hypothetical protein